MKAKDSRGGGHNSLHRHPPPTPPPGPSTRSQKFSPGGCLGSLSLSENLCLSLSAGLSSTSLAPAQPPPPLPGLETPRRSRGHNGVFHGFLHTLHHGEGNTGVFPSSAPEKERGFDRGSYFFLIYNPEALCSRPQRPRAGATERVSRRRGFA